MYDESRIKLNTKVKIGIIKSLHNKKLLADDSFRRLMESIYKSK